MALLAKERAASCERDPYPEHSSSFIHIGWNTHLSAYGVTSFSDVIHSWFEEGKDFLYLSGQCRENATCQHYTQVLTSRTVPTFMWSCTFTPHSNCVFFLNVLMCLNCLLLCSWCGPLPVTLAVPASCV